MKGEQNMARHMTIHTTKGDKWMVDIEDIFCMRM